MDDESLYVATRQWWRIGSERMKLGSTGLPSGQWLFTRVSCGLFTGSSAGASSAEAVAAEPSLKGRWAFSGELDPELTERYVGSDVSAKLPVSAQNPIRYVNCD